MEKGEKVVGFAVGEIFPYTDHRLLVWYGEKLCPIVRFAFTKDGSINFSPYLKGASEIAIQQLTSSDSGLLNVEYGKGEITPKMKIKGGNLLKVNYHASGFIHFGNERKYGPPLRGLTKEIEVALIIIMHPSEMGLIQRSEVRKTDMVTGFRAEDAVPLHVRFSIAPLSIPCALPVGNQQQWLQCLHAKNLVDDIPSLNATPDLRYNFHIRECSNGPWPPECGVLFPVTPGQPPHN